MPAKYRALIVTFLAFHIDTLLYYFLVPLLPHYVNNLGFSSFQIGILFGSYALALLAATYPAGRLTDRYGRKKPMLWGLFGLMIATALFAWSTNFAWLLLARCLQGAAGALTWVPGMALIADHFPNEERGRALSITFMGANLGVFLGPTLAGYLATHFSYRSPFYVGIILIIIDTLGRLFFVEDVVNVEKSETIPIRRLLGHSRIQVFMIAMMLATVLWSFLESVLPVYLDRRFSSTPQQIGWIFGFLAVMHGLTSPVIGSLTDRIGRPTVLRLGLWAMIFLIILPSWMPSSLAVGLLLGGIGLATTFIISPCSPGVAAEIEQMGSRAYASGFSMLSFSYSAGMVVGSFLGGVLVGPLGLSVSLGCLSLLCVGLLIFSYRVEAHPSLN